jgi:hypothetical protein
MYNAILSTVQSKVESKVDGIIPSGIAIQKLRATSVGDTVTRDGYHLNYGNGRYTAALTWLAYVEEHYFENENWQDVVNSVTWTPSGQTVSLELAKQSVIASLQSDAYDALEEETQTPDNSGSTDNSTDSSENTAQTTYRELTDEEREMLKAYLGSNYTGDYVVLDWQPTYKYFWNSSAGDTLNNNYNPPETFMSSGIRFTSSDIPVGSVIWVQSGYQYRPDAWNTETGKSTASRPGNVSTEYVTVTESWWSGWTYRGFNLSKTSGTLDGSETDALKIFIPIGHNLDTDNGAEISTIEYLDGFDKLGTITYTCARCGKFITEETPSAPVIFTVKGYSSSEVEGVSGIKAGYAVDREALAEYNKYSENKVEYGMVVSSTTYAGIIKSAVLGNDEAKDNIFYIDLTKTDYASFNCTVQGFADDGSEDKLQLVMLAFVKVGNEVQYLQTETNSGLLDAIDADSYGNTLKTINLATVKSKSGDND